MENKLMENKTEFQMLHRAFIAVSFIVIFIVHAMTVQPSVPFWDCGERLCAMTWQQIPHPPGTPIFAMIGKIFQIIIPFGDLGWRGNMVSVAASAFVIALLYMMSVIVIKNLRKDPIANLRDALAVYGSAFIGAMAFGFSATFWFNSVEAETYVTAILVVSLVMYLLMRWTQIADEEGNERYLLLSVYLVGISIGIHQLSILVIFTIILTIYFRKYQVTPKTFIALTAAGLGVFFFVFQVIVLSLPAFLSGRTANRTEAYEYAIENSAFLQFATVAGIVILCYLLYWGYKNRKPIVALVSFGLVSIIFSFSTYAQVILRAEANPPMNQNAPKNFSVLASYIGREQYGSAPMWPRRYSQEDHHMRMHNRRDKNGDFIYGQWNPPGRKILTRKDGAQVWGNDWSNANTSGELNYLWKYQMNQMYFRYLFWNYVGRMSDVQDAGVVWFDKKESEELNYKSGYTHLFPVQYFGIPLLFGLIGLYYHLRRNPRNALIFLATFIVMGVLTSIYQNQQNPQPRERDYFYMGSFLVWGLWIGLGTYGLIDMLSKKNKTTIIAALLLVTSFVIVPFNMAYSNIKAYSRAGNFLPFDYAYNMLQSVEQDAIIFTNGDNDTFCVWFIQDVIGVRRDVRICNLSLGNTLWYVDQLKNREPWGSKRVPLSFPDNMLQVEDDINQPALSYEFSEAKIDRIPVRKEILAQFTDNQAIIDAGAVTFTFIGRQQQQRDGKQIYLHRVQDKIVRDIIVQTKFERPVYYSNSVGSDATCGLERYFRAEGLCYRICPVEQRAANGDRMYNEEVMDKYLLNIDNSNDYTKTQQYGMKLRNLNNIGVYYDETARRTIMMSYPNVFIGYANYLVEAKGDFEKAERILESFLTNISITQFPLPLETEHQIANIYRLCENKAKTEEFARLAIKTAEEQIANADLEPYGIQFEEYGRYYGPYQRASDMYKLVGDWDNAKLSLQKLIAKMSSIKSQIEAGYGGSREDLERLEYAIARVTVVAELVDVEKLESEGKFAEALAAVKQIEEKFSAEGTNPFVRYFLGSVTSKRNELESRIRI